MLRHLRVAGLVATILTLAACGPASSGEPRAKPDTSYPGKTAAQVLELAQNSLKGITALQLDGTATATSSDDTGTIPGAISGPVTFSFHVMNGVGTSGSLSVGTGGSLKLVMVRDTTYMLMDQKLLNQLGPVGASIGSVLKGRWVVSDAEEAAANLSSLAGSIGTAQSALTGITSTGTALVNVPAGSTLTRIPGKLVNGTQTTGVKFNSPKTADAEAVEGTIYIAVSGTPYPMELDRSGMSIEFGHWNEKVKIRKPVKADVISMDKLGLAGLSAAALTAELGSQAAGNPS